MIKKFQLARGLVALSLLIGISSCVARRSSNEIGPDSSVTNGGASLARRELVERPKVRGRGENVVLEVVSDFKTTVLESTPPRMWLEFDDPTLVSRIEFSTEVCNRLRDHWRRLFQYRYEKDYGVVTANQIYEHTISGVNLKNELLKIVVKSPSTNTYLTDEEVNEIIDVQVNLLVARYEEIKYRFPEVANE